jgi:hypothetical protein
MQVREREREKGEIKEREGSISHKICCSTINSHFCGKLAKKGTYNYGYTTQISLGNMH